MSLVENIHHYFLCFLALTHSFNFTTFSSSSSNHQARTSSKLFHLIFRNKTPKCKFNVIFFFIFCYVDTRDILYNMLYASPKNGFFNVHFGPEGVIIEIFLGTSNYLKVDFFFFGKSPWGILIDGAFQCEWWSFVKIDAHLDSYLFRIFLFIIIEPFSWESFMICVLSCSGNKYKLFIRSRWSHYWLPKWLSLFRRGNDKFIVCKNEWQILAVNIVCACFMNQ